MANRNNEHIPTEVTKAQAETASGLGLPHEQIAALIGISDVTLRKHYKVELAVGKAKASAKIAQTLFNKAVKGDTTAGIWWTKAQMGWSEKTQHEITGAGGEPFDVQITFVRPGELPKPSNE